MSPLRAQAYLCLLFRKLRSRVTVWNAVQSHIIETKYLAELWPSIGDTRAHTKMNISHSWETPYGERAVLDALVRYLRPRLIFEFGTFTGSTTTLLADACPPESKVHTLDVAPKDIGPDYLRLGGVTEEMMGREFVHRKEYRDSIVFHRCSTRDFDFAPYRDKADLVYLDASHTYEDVLYDSERALEILSAKGVIVWDDSSFPRATSLRRGIRKAINEIAQEIRLVRVASTRLVLHVSSDELTRQRE